MINLNFAPTGFSVTVVPSKMELTITPITVATATTTAVGVNPYFFKM